MKSQLPLTEAIREWNQPVECSEKYFNLFMSLGGNSTFYRKFKLTYFLVTFIFFLKNSSLYTKWYYFISSPDFFAWSQCDPFYILSINFRICLLIDMKLKKWSDETVSKNNASELNVSTLRSICTCIQRKQLIGSKYFLILRKESYLKTKKIL